MAVVDESALERAWLAGEPFEGSENARHIDADIIRRFCVRRRDEVDPRGIGIRHAVITGTLDLAGVEVPFPLRFEHCAFEAAPQLDGAQLHSLAFLDCAELPGLLANGLRVQRDLDLSRSVITGGHRTTASTSKRSAIWLCEAEIGGRMLCLGTTIRPDGERAIQADRLHVGGNIRFILNFRAYGEIRLIGAYIRGSLDLTGAQVESDTDWALDLGDAHIEGALFITNELTGRPTEIRGRIDMRHTRIGGQMFVRNVTLTKTRDDPATGTYEQPRRPGTVLAASRAKVGAGIAIVGTTTINGGVDLSASELDSLSIADTCRLAAPGLTALDLTNAELRSSLVLKGVTVQGTIRLASARIGGQLDLTNAVLSDPEGTALLRADGSTIDSNVELQGTTATGGELSFWRATLGSTFDARRATVHNRRGLTVRIHQAEVKGSVRLMDGFSSEGCVMLNRSVVDGRVDLTRGRFVCDRSTPYNPDGHGVQAIATNTQGGLVLDWAEMSPSVDMTDAHADVLVDDPTNWPERFFIAGFTYNRFAVPDSGHPSNTWDWRKRRDWLARQAIYDAGPYEQAARVFRQHGYTYGAEQILIAQRTQARRATTGRSALIRRPVDAAYGWSVGYGYRPGRVLWLLMLLLVLVSATLLTPVAQQTMRATDEAGNLYGTTGMVTVADAPATDECGDGRVRCFNPILYGMDTVVPLIALDQRSTWYPDPNIAWGAAVEWWLNLATIVGWLLSTIFILSFARMARTMQ